LQTNVRFRIDSETPNVTIQHGELAASFAILNTATVQGGVFGGNSSDGPQNSDNANATTSALETITLSGNAPFVEAWVAGRNGLYQNINTYIESFYTARKDYIAATAERSNLARSGRSYEGVFKTVIVYRNPPTAGGALGSTRFVRTEAVDTQNGTVTISGFPMRYNDMSGASSRFAYRIPAGERQTAGDDWVFITWEIVSNFWHVGMLVLGQLPTTNLENDPWQFFSGDWRDHNFRKYGNWGLRIGP
jgi:hypothetical protein